MQATLGAEARADLQATLGAQAPVQVSKSLWAYCSQPQVSTRARACASFLANAQTGVPCNRPYSDRRSFIRFNSLSILIGGMFHALAACRATKSQHETEETAAVGAFRASLTQSMVRLETLIWSVS